MVPIVPQANKYRMTQQLYFDFSQPALQHSEFFYPLDLKLDPEEKQNFINTVLVQHRNKIEGSGYGLSNVGNADRSFPKTIAATDLFLKPLGLITRRLTLFLSDQSQTSWVVHCDGVRGPDGPAMLEARLSFYEIAEQPGAIRWWNHLPNTGIKVYPPDSSQHTQERITCFADCAEPLRDNQLTWNDIPSPDFTTVSSAPSAILRTNRFHHVIQGPGLRVTVSCQLVFPNGSPIGVWQHIENNIHKLGV
jgi:hypothetical protein